MRATVSFSNGTVRVVNAGTFSFRLWLNQTKAAIKIMHEAVGRPHSRRSDWAVWWLRSIGLCSKEDVDAFESRIPLIDQPADPSRIIRCSRCLAPLSDPVSKLYRMGPDCRSGRVRQRARTSMTVLDGNEEQEERQAA